MKIKKIQKILITGNMAERYPFLRESLETVYYGVEMLINKKIHPFVDNFIEDQNNQRGYFAIVTDEFNIFSEVKYLVHRLANKIDAFFFINPQMLDDGFGSKKIVSILEIKIWITGENVFCAKYHEKKSDSHSNVLKK